MHPDKGGHIMKIFGMKTSTAGVIASKTFKFLFLMGSFLLLAWIAYCLSLLTADFLSFGANDHRHDVEIMLIEC